jgi:hypothetical protein
MTSLELVLREITEERGRQDIEFGGPNHDDIVTRSEWGAIILRHGGLAMGHSAKADNDDEIYRRQLIRVAAIAVAAIQSHDRKVYCKNEKFAGQDPASRGSGF